jgi:hypothetical protein
MPSKVTIDVALQLTEVLTMPDETVVHIGENSPEHVAYRLFKDIAEVESRQLFSHGDNPADREYILETYRECLRAVGGSPTGRART